MDDRDIIPIDALFGEALEPNPTVNYGPRLQRAEVIIGHDWDSGQEFIVFGRDALKGVVAGGATRRMNVVRIGLDQDTDAIERLLGLVLTLKGSHDYVDGGRS